MQTTKTVSMKKLTREEMKNVSGGKRYSCNCIGSVGSWTGNYGPGGATAAVHQYCSSGHGWCNSIEA